MAQVRAPVTFVFSEKIASEGKRVFPFDSGAFYNQLYKRWFHENSSLLDFEMPAGCSAPELHMGVFFESVEKYFDCEARTPPIPIDGNFEAESIMNMLTDKGSKDSDDRRVAIELQLSKALSIYDERLIGIILPESLVSSTYFIEFLKRTPKTPIVQKYRLQAMKPASDYQTQLEMLARQIQSGL